MDKAIFHGEIANMMNKDSHWAGSGNRTFTTDEMNTFIDHVWNLFQKETVSVDERKLFDALMQTQRYESMQDRAHVIVVLLKEE